MERQQPDVIFRGAVGGIIAGAVVAVWFLLVDFATAEPFSTPAPLASIVLGEEYAGPWPRLVTMYSILHFGVFITLGAGTAWLLELIDVEPGLIIGAVFGIGVLNVVHYSGLLITGTNLLTVVPVAHVVAANLLGGMLMMAYLHRAGRAESPFGWNVLRGHPVLYNGLIAGLVGATAVAFWFFLIDLITRSTPFYAPAALGSAVLLGARSAAEIHFSVGVIVAYSFLHLAAFAGVGIAFAWLARRVRQAPGFWVRAVVLLVLLEGLFLGTLAIFGGWVVGSLGWLAVLVANVLAVVSMALLLWRRMRGAEVVAAHA